jgi:hypothetical protein
MWAFRRSGIAAVACAVSLALVAGLSLAQEEKRGADSKSAEKDEVKGRLPIYFGQIGLSKKQEDDVRKAAQPYDEKIAQIKKQIKDLDKQVQDQEAAKLAACEKLLTDNQKTVIKERRSQAEVERADRKKSNKKTANGDGGKPEEKK